MTPVRLYCDTSVYVAVILGPHAPGYHEGLEMLRAAERGVYEAVLSALVPAEVVGAPSIRAPQGFPKAYAAARMDAAVSYFGQSGFRYLEIDKRAGQRAASIAREFDMKGADALHLAVAEINGCGLFCTWDKDQLKVGKSISGMSVEQPALAEQGELDFS